MVDLSSDALGNLTRIENEIGKIPARLEAAKTRKAETMEQLANAKTEVQKPFAFEDELKEKTDRLNALNIELNIDEKDTSVMDTNPENSPKEKVPVGSDNLVCTFVLLKSGQYNRGR